MKSTALTLAAAVLAAGCTSPQLAQEARTAQAEILSRGGSMNAATVRDGDLVRGSAEHADKLATEQLKRPVMRYAQSAYIGSRMVPVTADDSLPLIFNQPFNFDVDDGRVGRTVTLSAIANRISNTTGIPIRIAPDVEGLAVNSVVVPTRVVQPTDGNAVQGPAPLSLDSASLKYSGPLKGFLTKLSDRLGLAWEYRDGTAVIMRFVTESFEVSSFIGKVTMNRDAGQAGGSTTQQSDGKMSINEKGDADAFETLEKTIGKMIAQVPGSDLIRTDGSKRIFVKTSREMMAQVRDLVSAENASMRKQALVQFDIYSVQTNDQDERGLNLNLLFNSLSNTYGVSVGSPSSLTGLNAAQVGINILRGDSDTSRKFADSEAIVRMLNQLGSNAQHRTVPFIAMNGSWARKSQLTTESYISETTPGAGSVVGSGAPGIKTDKVTTGDQYQILPQIYSDNTVMLKLGFSLSDLLGLTDQTSGIGVNQQKVQTTKVSSNSEQSDVYLKPGEVMSITGLSRVVSTGDQRSLSEGTPIGFGGSRRVGVARQHFIVFVRAVVL